MPIPSSGTTANSFYQYTSSMIGSFSGGTFPSGSSVPYPEFGGDNNGQPYRVKQLNAVTLGGQYGLNN